MKIIATDNYDRENVSDTLVAENVSEWYAKLIAKLLNNSVGPDSDRYFKAVPDDHKLFIFEP